MRHHFAIGAPKSLLILILSAHAATGMIIIFYLEPTILKVLGLGIIGFLAMDEAKHLFQHELFELVLSSDGSEIEFRQAGEPYFYDKYKVYQTRWFAILKVIDKKNTRTLLLNPERFDSDRSYRQLRYILQSKKRLDAA